MAIVLSSLYQEPIQGAEWLAVVALLLCAAILFMATPRPPRKRGGRA